MSFLSTRYTRCSKLFSIVASGAVVLDRRCDPVPSALRAEVKARPAAPRTARSQALPVQTPCSQHRSIDEPAAAAHGIAGRDSRRARPVPANARRFVPQMTMRQPRCEGSQGSQMRFFFFFFCACLAHLRIAKPYYLLFWALLTQ